MSLIARQLLLCIQDMTRRQSCIDAQQESCGSRNLDRSQQVCDVTTLFDSQFALSWLQMDPILYRAADHADVLLLRDVLGCNMAQRTLCFLPHDFWQVCLQAKPLHVTSTHTCVRHISSSCLQGPQHNNLYC